MSAIFGSVYMLLFLSYILMGLFIVFHIFRYSLKRNYAFFGVTIFSVVFLLLLLTNVILFTAIPFDQLITLRSF